MTLVLVIFNKICYSYVNDRGDDMAENRFIPSDDEVNQNIEPNSVNERNSQEFQNLMEHSQKKYDNYWDINSPFVRIILIILLIIIVVGSAYYFIIWFRQS